MPDQVVPITQLDQVGVILDTPPVALPPNAFTNARNVRFKDGAVRKMEGEVDIFGGMRLFFEEDNIGQLEYIAWWPSPNQTIRDAGYYVFVVENTSDINNTTHDIYAMLPGATFDEGDNPLTKPNHYHRLNDDTGYTRTGKWQHTLFNGGFTFIINNGFERPQYITDAEGNTDITQLALADLPGWDSYQVNEILLRDTFDSSLDSDIFDTGQTRVAGVTQYVVTRIRQGSEVILTETADTSVEGYSISQSATNAQDVITFHSNTLSNNDELQINFQSVNPVAVRAAIVRSFGDFLVAGNLVERDSMSPGDPIVRRLTGVVRSSDVAQPGAIPNNWNPFAAGASTADEFVIADTGTVQDMVPLQGNMYLYTNSSISVMRLTGNANVPLAVQPVTDQYGALTTDAVLEYDGKHFVIGSDDIYLFGGHPGSIQSVSDQKVRRTFFERVNPINQNLINLFTLRYAARDEIWVCFPTVDSVRGEADEAYIWNYRNGTWSIRTLNSVIRGDIAPVPGGGVPSAVISLSGQSGTDDVIRAGSHEVQTLQVGSTASVGPARDPQPELQTFSALAALPDGTARPDITADAAELIQVQIGSDFYSGPNPAMHTYDLTGLTGFVAGAFTSGGARLVLTYTDPTTSAVSGDGIATIHANELGLTAGMVTATEYVDALVTYINDGNVLEFANWTASNNSGNLRLTSDIPGARFLGSGQALNNIVSFTTYTSQAEIITDTGPFTDETRVFSDTLGDELFTVTRTGLGPYSYSVTTARDTGFTESDDITQLAFISDGNTFSAPDPFNASESPFIFNSDSDSYEIRSTPPANFINLIRQTDNIPNSGEGTFDPAVTEDGVTIDRATTEGGFTQNGMGTQTFENVVVTVADTTIPATTRTVDAPISDGTPGAMSQFAGSTISQPYNSAAPTYIRNMFPGAIGVGGGTGWNANGGRVMGEFARVLTGSTNGRTFNSGITGISFSISGGSFYGTQNLTYANRVAGTGAIGSDSIQWRVRNSSGFTWTTTFSVASGRNFGGAGVRTEPRWSYQRDGNSGFDTVINVNSMTYGDATVSETVAAIPRRSFQVNNPNPYTIDFVSNSGVVFNNLSGNSATVNGPNGNADEGWSWSSDPISFSGTSISGSGTTPVADLTNGGLAETTMHGVTVRSQSTAEVEFSTTSRGPEQAVLAPASNGNSLANPETFTWNPTRSFYWIEWTGSTSSDSVGAYRLSDGSRVSGAVSGLNSRTAPSGWFTTGAESGVFHPVTFSASNITDPVGIGRVRMGGATANQGVRFDGIRQRGSTDAGGPSLAVGARSAAAGNPWLPLGQSGNGVPTEQRRSGGNHIYQSTADPATNIRIVISGPVTDITVTTPRNSRETITITNSNPFAVIFTRAGVQTSVPANGSVTLTNVAGEGVAWDISTPTTTQYQFTVTNNNARPLVSGTLTHGSGNVDLAGLAPGAEAVTGFDTDANAGVTFVREIPQQTGGSTSVNAMYTLVQSGIGRVGVTQEAVRYNFSVNFLDNTPDISIDYQTPQNRVPGAPGNLDNLGAEQGFIAALNANAAFARYFNAFDADTDPGVPAGAFRIEARAIPGEEVSPGVLMPPHDALRVSAVVDQDFGGNSGLGAADAISSIRRAQSLGNDPITVMFSTGTRVLQTDGSLMPIRSSTHSVTLQGAYTAAETGAINEQFRQVFRNDPDYVAEWNIVDGTDSLNPASINLESDENGPHHNTITSVTPVASGLTPEFFSFASTQVGRVFPMMPELPMLTLMPPTSVTGNPVMITLDNDSSVNLTPAEIADRIRTQFNAASFPGWIAQTDLTEEIYGRGVAGNLIKLVNTEAGAVMGSWTVSNIDYGNTGTTVFDNSIDTTLGRLRTTDFTRIADGTSNLDFRGMPEERSQPTRIIVSINNNNVEPDGEGNRIQYLNFVLGTRGTYDPVTQLGDLGTRQDASTVLAAIQNGIEQANRRVVVTPSGDTLTVVPTQFSELASFVIGLTINNSAENAREYNRLVGIAPNLGDDDLIDLNNNEGIQSTALPIVRSSSNNQFTPGTRAPAFTGLNVDTTNIITSDTVIERIFDPLRPWPTTQVNLNREFPIFVNAILDETFGDLDQTFRGADIGFLFLGNQYESFVERIEMAITPEFDTEQIQSLALWGDGGNSPTFGADIEQATLDIKMYGTNSPGETRGRFTTAGRTDNDGIQRSVTNQFAIGDDYKIDMRIHGRFLNLLISDFEVDEIGSRSVIDSNTAGVTWSISGMQADIVKGGRR